MKQSPITEKLFDKYNSYTDGDSLNLVLWEDEIGNFSKDLWTEFLDFLLREGYVDSDVYCEPPTAIDAFLNERLRWILKRDKR